VATLSHLVKIHTRNRTHIVCMNFRILISQIKMKLSSKVLKDFVDSS
jgi:hypothetical protein